MLNQNAGTNPSVAVKTKEVYESHSGNLVTCYRGRGCSNRLHHSKHSSWSKYNSRPRGSRFTPSKDGRNTLDKEVNVALCMICKSEFHCANQCPHRREVQKSVWINGKSTVFAVECRTHHIT